MIASLMCPCLSSPGVASLSAFIDLRDNTKMALSFFKVSSVTSTKGKGAVSICDIAKAGSAEYIDC